MSTSAGPALTVVNRLLDHAHHPVLQDKPAMGMVGGETGTYREVAARAAALRSELDKAGLQRGDIVAVSSENAPLIFEALFACALGGYVFMPLNIHFTVTELRAVIEAYRPAYAIGHGAGIQVMPEVLGASQVRDIETDPLYWHPSQTHDLPRGLVGAESEHAPVWIALTGGTTGLPKASVISNRSLAVNTERAARVFDYDPQGSNLVCGPLYHAQALIFALLQLEVGGTIQILPRFEAAEVADAIEHHEITHLCMVPTMWTDLLTELKTQQPTDPLGSLRVAISAGSPLRSSVKDRFADLLPNVGLFEYYGSTEGGYYTVLRPDERAEHNDTVGTPFPGVQIEVRRPDGTRCGPDEPGTIYRFGEPLGGSYLGRPDLTAELYSHGWLTNGDIGHLDADGFLRLGDRHDDMIITGGVNVFPGDIEQVIAALPHIREVAIVGIPHERWGEAVTAFVALTDHIDEKALTEKVMSACREQLAAYKVPKAVHVLDALPKTSVGKVRRADLKQWSTLTT